MSNSAEKKQNSFWFSFKLKAQLLRIWFMKNIVLWIQIFCIVCLVFMLTGNITADTPILGVIVYPFFKPLVDEIVLAVSAKDMNGLMDFFAIVISILTSIGLFTMKAKRIAQSDIKSDKLKIALIKANMYFNKDGRLVKKTEAMVGVDLDGDGVIEGEAKVPTNIFSGIAGAVQEFKTIVTADLKEVETEEEAQDKYEDILIRTDLKDDEENLKEIGTIIKEGTKELGIDLVNEKLDEKIEEVNDETMLTSEEKEKKTSIFRKLKNLFKKKEKEEKPVEETSNEEVIVNNIENDAKVEEQPKQAIIKEEKKEEKVSVTETRVIQQPAVRRSNNSIDNDISDFLSRMKG